MSHSKHYISLQENRFQSSHLLLLVLAIECRTSNRAVCLKIIYRHHVNDATTKDDAIKEMRQEQPCGNLPGWGNHIIHHHTMMVMVCIKVPVTPAIYCTVLPNLVCWSLKWWSNFHITNQFSIIIVWTAVVGKKRCPQGLGSKLADPRTWFSY